jgi:acyl carrier protein
LHLQEGEAISTARKAEIKRIIAEELKLREELLRDDLTMEDLGFDSLASAEIILAIEQKLRLPIDTAQVAAQVTRDASVAQLIDAIDAASQEA